MSTITPTADQTQISDHTVFQIGDVVRSNTDGRIGTIVAPQGQPLTATPANPATSNVDVNWIDGTASVVALSTLSRA